MRSLLRAAVFLAPALATSLSTRREDESSSALIKLNLPLVEDDSAKVETSFRLGVLESSASCGYGNVTLNGQSLSQDSTGVGSGSIGTEQGNLIATWKFICVDELEQMMEFNVNSINGKGVDSVGFTAQFHQTSPVWISYIKSAEAVIEAPKHDPRPMGDEGQRDLEDEIAQLESMKRQLVELKHAIFMKEQFLSQAFGFHDKSSKVTNCDNLKCIFLSVYDSVKDFASTFYGEELGGEGFFGGRHGKHGKFPHFGGHFPHHGNHTHGNHTFPHPPFKHPHPPPHFCHCPPPPHHEHDWPHHGPPHGPPPGPPHRFPPHGPPHRGPGDETDNRPPFDRHDELSPPPPHHDDFEDRPGRHEEDMPPPPPPPPFEGDEDQKPDEYPFHAEAELREGEGRGPHRGDGPPREHGEGPPHGPPRGDGPPHGHGEGPPPHGPPRGDGPPNGRGGRPPHSPPPFDFHRIAKTIPTLRIFATVIVVGFLLVALHTRCFTTRREQRRQRRAAKRTARNGKFMKMLRKLTGVCTGRDALDEEKEAIMNRIHEEDSDSDDISTTMEQEIEQFRTAASVVGDMVAAEEGRARQQMTQYSPVPVPPSPTSAFPDYMPVDEVLPAYDEAASDSSSFVADGIRYTPGSSTYTPSDVSVNGSLDEVLGRKD